jgi:hypothetical protein
LIRAFELKHCDNTATNANGENVRSRMKASFAGKHEYGDRGRLVLGVFGLLDFTVLLPVVGHFETYEPFYFFNFAIFTLTGEPWMLNGQIQGHTCSV